MLADEVVAVRVPDEVVKEEEEEEEKEDAITDARSCFLIEDRVGRVLEVTSLLRMLVDWVS